MKFLSRLAIFCLAILAAACSSQPDSADQADRERYKLLASENQMALQEDCSKGKKAFADSVHQYIRSANKCLECHDNSGPGPSFAVENLDLSYLRVKSRIQWANPEKSVFVVRGGEDHGGVGATEKLLLDLVSKWWDDGEKECKQAGTYVTDPVSIPALGSPSSGWKKLKFDLKNTDELLAGASLEVEIENFADAIEGSPGAYRVRKPRLINGDHDVTIQGISLLVNGFPENNSGGYAALSVRGSKKSSATLSTKTLIFLKNDVEKDVFSVSIGKILKAEPLNCSNESMFKEKIQPILQNRNCFICHGGGIDGASGVAAARAGWDMIKDFTGLCKDLKLRSYFDDPVQSVFWSFPANSVFGHPKTNFLNFEKEAVEEWVNLESKDI